MIKMALLIFIGMLIGWNIPQPAWAKRLTNWLKSLKSKL